ncbi:hypothetical protein ABK040_005543 [Willaertia magna]
MEIKQMKESNNDKNNNMLNIDSTERKEEELLNNTLLKYMSIESCGGLSFGTNQFSFIYNGAGNYQIYSTPLLLNKDENNDDDNNYFPLASTRLTFEIERCTDAHFIPNSPFIVFHQDNKGDEKFQLGIIETYFHKELKEISSKNLRIFTCDKNAKYLLQKIDNEFIYYLSNKQLIKEFHSSINENYNNNLKRNTFHLYRVSIKDLINCKGEEIDKEKSEIIYFNNEPGIIPFVDVIEKDRSIVLSMKYSTLGWKLKTFDIGSNNITDLTNANTNRWNGIRWLDENHLLVTTDIIDNNLMTFAIVNKSNPGIVNIVKGFENQKFEFQNAMCNENDPFVYFIENRNGYSKLFRAKFYSNATISDFEELPLPYDGNILRYDTRVFTHGLELSPDGNYLAYTLNASNSPSCIYLLNLKTKRTRKLTNIECGGLIQSDFVKSELFLYKSFDGMEIPYFRYLPNNNKLLTSNEEKKVPCFFILHGGPNSQSKDDFDPRVQFFLECGFAVVLPNIRGSNGYGKQYLLADEVEKRLDSIKDIKYLALHLKENDPMIDTEKIIVMGGSYGGYATLCSLCFFPEMNWLGGVSMVGMSNLVTFLQNTANWRRKNREAEYGSLDKDLEVLERVSPINKASDCIAPIYFIHGAYDERVPLSETLNMYEKVKDNNPFTTLLQFENEGHGVTNKDNKIKSYTLIIQWVRKLLKEKQ